MSNNKIDFAIITALPKELEAVLSKLGTCKTIADKSGALLFYQGNIGDAKVIVTRSGPGNIKATHAATVVWERYHPISLLMVGIAAGFKDKVKLGDVVVAESCYYDRSGKDTAGGILPAPQQFSTSRFLCRRSLDYQNMDWKAQIHVHSPKGEFQPQVHHGVIASSERFIGNEQGMESFLAAHRECRAVAMEGYGVAEVAWHHEVDFLEVRGICDFGDAHKVDKWHDYAADVAATYAVGLLRYIEAIYQSRLSKDSTPSVSVRHDTGPKLDRVDFAIITALPEELNAVIFQLGQLGETKSVIFPKEPLVFYTGQVDKKVVMVTKLLDKGNVEAARVATVILERYKPSILLMVGIAAGIRAQNVKLGDVVVATDCYYYEFAKLVSGGEQISPKTYTTDAQLCEITHHYPESAWQPRITCNLPTPVVRPCKVHHGVIGSGEKVIADEQKVEKMLTSYSKLRAVAMEGFGAATAVSNSFWRQNTAFLEIRGISDFGGEDKNDECHEYASHVAAAYAIGLLSHVARTQVDDTQSGKD